MAIKNECVSISGFRRRRTGSLTNLFACKGGHILLGEHGELWAIDNGLSFHHEFKLRTVIWDFAGDDISIEVRDGLTALLDDGVSNELCELLNPIEQDGVLTRARSLLHAQVYPSDPTGRRYPWPMV